MAQLFTLAISNNSETCNFLDGTNYKVLDGGFDIGTPVVNRKLSFIRPGFKSILSSVPESREATAVLAVIGSDRGEVVANINKIERVLATPDTERVWIPSRGRAQLTYAWEDNDYITYFEILYGEVILPGDVLSVEKMFSKYTNAEHYVAGVTVKLTLSAYGYGQSIFSTPSVEIPLANSSVGTPTTGGVDVQNLYYPYNGGLGTIHDNYVEIAGSDLPGAQPFITKFTYEYNSTVGNPLNWERMYIGLRQSPFPAQTALHGSTGAVGPTNNGPSAGYYYPVTHVTTTSPWFSDILGENPDFEIDPSGLKGKFLVILHAYANKFDDAGMWASSILDYVVDQMLIRNQWRTGTNGYHLPTGVLSIPYDMNSEGVSGTWETIHISIHYAQGRNLNLTYDIDFFELLPVDYGMRLIRKRGGTASSIWYGLLTDDSWLNRHYLVSDYGGYDYIMHPSVALLNPITLAPNKDQRVYFSFFNDNVSGLSHGNGTINVRLWVVPTYKTLAL